MRQFMTGVNSSQVQSPERKCQQINRCDELGKVCMGHYFPIEKFVLEPPMQYKRATAH